jgi:serine protease Do
MNSSSRVFHRCARGLGLAAVVAFAFLASGAIQAQPKLDTKSILKSSPKVLALFQEVVAKPSESTVRVKCNGKDAALGAVVGAEGWILTKFTELSGTAIVCRLKDGRELPATIVGVHDKCDLAMLKIDASNLKPVEWAESKVAPVGHWVASPGAAETPAAIGVVSVAARNVSTKGAAPAPSPTSGYLGVSLDVDAPGVKINQVLPGTGAEKAGLKVNDQILAVNSEAVETAEAFMALLQRMKPGDTITLKIVRSDKEMELKATLGKRPNSSRGDFQNSLGSELSSRRTGFPTILQHDSVLKPSDCGGPLVDLDGRVIGINIARAGRTESYAIPTEVVLPLLTDLRSGKLAPPASVKADPGAKLTPEDLQKLADARAALRKAEADLAEAEKKAAEARAALEKLQQQLDKK